MSDLFMVIDEMSEGAGGQIIVAGYDYDDLASCLVDRYDLVADIYGDQIEQEDPEVYKYVERFRDKTNYRKSDIRNFNISVLGVHIGCSEVFRGKKGFKELTECLNGYLYGDCDKDLIRRLEKSYDDDDNLDRIIDEINEKLWRA